MDERIYIAIQTVVISIFVIACVVPFIHIIGVSLSPQRLAMKGVDYFWPPQMSLEAYGAVVKSANLMRGVVNSTIITVFGTAIAMVLTSTFAYGLSVRGLPGRRLLTLYVLVTMVFHASLVPLYIAIKTLGLLNTFPAVILPLAINPFWCLIMRNFFEAIPQELSESAYIDGASEQQIYARVVLPLSMPAVAAFTLFYSVMYWNSFFHALMFLSDLDKWPVQVWLRQLISSISGAVEERNMEEGVVAPVTVQMAVVLVAMGPILLVYPFLQKHFAKGVMLGAVKG
jgi:putative aldouronate transport system permease protein